MTQFLASKFLGLLPEIFIELIKATLRNGKKAAFIRHEAIAMICPVKQGQTKIAI